MEICVHCVSGTRMTVFYMSTTQNNLFVKITITSTSKFTKTRSISILQAWCLYLLLCNTMTHFTSMISVSAFMLYYVPFCKN